jgi:eukaryotic-like serine/threonine-protein kinase
MSPEQASGDPDQIDERSDVYSLGATLYCLLTGKTAFQSRDEAGQALSIERLLDRIRSGQFKSPLQVDPSIPKPLAAICTHAMATPPDDRYADPLKLADDLERWLADEPVTAYREPTMARVRRWVKRHQTLTATALAIVLVSIVGLTSFSIVLGQKNVQLAGLADSLQSKNEQLDQRSRELQQSNAELVVAEQLANEKAAIATAVTEFLNDDLLSQASPAKRPDPQLQVRSVFKQAFDTMQDRFVEQPMVKASLLHTIGVASGYLAESAQSKAALTEAYRLRLETLGPRHPDTLTSHSALGEVYLWNGQYAEAEEILTQTLTHQSELLGSESEDALKTTSRLAGVYGQTGRYDLATTMIDQAIAGFTKLHGKDALQTLEMQSLRASLLAEMSLYNESLTLARDLQQRSQATLGATHLLTLESMMLVAQQLYFLNRTEEAKTIYQETLQRIIESLGAEHPYVSVIRNDLAMIEYDAGDPNVALQTLRELEAISIRRYGPKHRETLISRLNIGNALVELGRLEEARELFTSCLADSIASQGPASSVTQKNRVLLASLNFEFDDIEGARALLNEVLHQQGETSKQATVDVLEARGMLASIDLQEERYPEAIESLEAIQQEYANLQMQRTTESLNAIGQLIDAFVYSEQSERLESLLVEVSEMFGKEDPLTQQMMLRVAENYVELDRRATAEKYLDRVSQWYRVQTSYPRETLDVAAYLAAILSQQERYQDAIAVYEALIIQQTERLGVNHVKRLSTMHDLAFVYSAIGSHQEALKLYDEVVRRRSTVYGEEGESTLISLENLAEQQMRVENYRAAADSLKRLAKARKTQGVDLVDLINVHYSLAESLRLIGQFSEAAEYYKATLDGESQSLGPLHVDTLLTMHNWAYSLDNAKQDTAAIEAYQQVVAGRSESLGSTHPHTLLSLGNLVLLQASHSDAEAAVATIADLQQRIETLDPSGTEVIDARYTIAEACRKIERYENAIEHYRSVADQRATTLGPLHEQTLLALHQVAYTSNLAGKKDAAVEVYADVVAGRSKTLGPAHPYTLLSLTNAGVIEFGRGRFAEADTIYSDLLARIAEAKGERHLDTVEAKTRLAGAKMMLRQYEQASDLFSQTVDLFRQLPRQKMTDDQKRTFGYALIFLGNAEVHHRQEVAAKRHVEEGLDLLQVVAPDDVSIGVALSVLGQLQTNDRQFEDARKSLMRAWDIQSKSKIEELNPSDSLAMLETVDRLIELHQKLDDAKEVEKWTEKRKSIRDAPASGSSEP